MKKKIIFLLGLSICPLHAEWFTHFFQRKKPFTILIDAAGDVNQSGRVIDNNFESSINFTIAQTLKNYFSINNTHIKVLLNRTPSEAVGPLQNAQFSNRINADFYLHICSIKTLHKPSLSFYQFTFGHNSLLKKDSLGFYPYDQLYLMHEKQSNEWGTSIKKNIDTNLIDTFGIYKMPLKPLTGINAPAIAIEVGLNRMEDLNIIIPQLHHALEQLINKM